MCYGTGQLALSCVCTKVNHNSVIVCVRFGINNQIDDEESTLSILSSFKLWILNLILMKSLVWLVRYTASINSFRRTISKQTIISLDYSLQLHSVGILCIYYYLVKILLYIKNLLCTLDEDVCTHYL